MNTAAAIVCVVLVTHTVVVGGMYVLHRLLSWSDAEQPGLVNYSLSFLSEWFCSLAALLTYPLGWLPTFPKTKRDPHGGPPILLVHGYVMNRATFLVFSWRLARAGFRNVRAVNIKPMFGRVDTLAERVLAIAQRYSKEHDGAPIIAIGHSQGGLLLRRAMHLTTEGPFSTIITIGTPHCGTKLGVLGLGANAADLNYASPFMRMLAAQAEVPVVSIYSRTDAMVIPAQSAAYGPRPQCVASLGHFAMMMSAAVFSLVVSEIGALQVQSTAQAARL